jgi:hypothetical protein
MPARVILSAELTCAGQAYTCIGSAQQSHVDKRRRALQAQRSDWLGANSIIHALNTQGELVNVHGWFRAAGLGERPPRNVSHHNCS